MTETTASRPTDALNEQDLEAVNAGSAVSDFMRGFMPVLGLYMDSQEPSVGGSNVAKAVVGGPGPGPSVSPLALVVGGHTAAHGE